MLKYSIESKFRLFWLCSASLVTLLRFLQVSNPGYDLGLQIQAARNLLEGNGLSLYRHIGLDLAEPAKLITLTHFPSGYSFCAAALMWVGISVGMTVKLLAAMGTLLGWWGWSRFAYPFFSVGLKRGSVWIYSAYAIAMFSPLLVTPAWDGTDIFLWAALPWVLDCLLRGSEESASNGRRLDVLAGALCGLCVLMRYASLFLVVYAACLILWQSRLRFPVLARRWASFGFGFLPALALQVYINTFLSNIPASPGGIGFSFEEKMIARIWKGIPLLSTANYPWVFWFPGNAVDLLLPGAAGQWPWQLAVTLSVFVLFVFVAKTYAADFPNASRDPRVASLGLFVVLPLVLWGCMMFSNYDFLGDRRYFFSLVPLGVFAVYSFVSFNNAPTRSGLTKVLQTLGVVYLMGYIAVSLMDSVLFFVPGERGARQLAKLMGGDSSHWPSMAVTYELSPARNFVFGLLKEQPNTVFVTSKAGWFYWDPSVDHSKLSELRCFDLQAAYLSGPARIVILTFDLGQPQELWYYTTDGSMRANCFEQLPDLKLLKRFPDERVKVLETRIGAGTRINLRPEQ